MVVDQQIDKEREGEQIDRALLKNVIDIFVEIGMGQMELYEQDFEAQMLQDSGAYYSRKASNWIVDDSCPDYMLKASLCTLFLYYSVVHVDNLCDSNNHYLIHLYRLRSV